ncbi:SGNH/GDSL hydrolase family protein [Nonomuraea spiralis]|uniref:SGNH/GDSL hydrolase family protein n=1 Tax=Nonomuraea TaxID=83681 RepID=UPI000F791F5F|nr:SGNH/GDSL hydrolase family protein [Nonomuraea sp. WAC 01424]RSM94481.1 SGNH/GDSL hydrolase family protein [Nonomuraea sp. WAC 01424]
MRPPSIALSVTLIGGLAANLLTGPAHANPTEARHTIPNTTSLAATAQQQSRAPLKWTALGDSYSANALVPRWDPTDGCARSNHNWESQLAQRLNDETSSSVRLTDVTCGAAEIDKGVLSPQTCDLLLGPPFNHGTCAWPARPAQIDALNGDEDIVTVGIGGNTLGFAAILAKCVEMGVKLGDPPTLGPGCSGYYENGEGRQWLADKFATLTREYTLAMRQIRERAPHAKVFLLGYPTVLSKPFNHTTCYWGNFKRLGTIRLGVDGDFLIGVEQRLNDVIRQQAADNSQWATYVDTYESSQGKGVCAAGTSQWMYGLFDDLVIPQGETKPADPAEYQCALRDELPSGVLKGEACTLIHPNVRGAANQAAQVHAAFQDAGLTSGSR